MQQSSRIVVLISGSGSNLQALIDQCQAGRINGEIVGVISNVESAYGLERAANAGISTAVLSHKKFESREAFDAELANLIDSFNPDVVVLAGFMRILSEGFVTRYLGKMLNIHPSLLPKYKGLHTHQRAIDAGDTKHGVSVHFVTPELDGGPVILQAIVPVLSDDTADTLAKRVLTQEHRIYPLALQLVAAGKVKLENNQVLVATQPLSTPIQFA